METVPVSRDKGPGCGGEVWEGGVCGGEEVCEVECMRRECVRSGMCGE